MEFKLTKWKIIGITIIILIFWIFLIIISSGINSQNIFSNFLQIHDMRNIISIGNLFLFLIEFIVVYLIWSFIQKKQITR